MHKLVGEGLLDKESFTQDDDQAVQKFVTGKSFIINGNSQTVVQHRTDMDKTLGKGKYAISKITVPGGTTELLQSMFSEEEQQFQKSMSETKTVVKPEPPIPYSVEERERVTLLSTPLKDYTDQNTLKFILGDRDLAEYDKFVQELDSQGVGQYLEIANKTYKKYKEQP
ncbi:hypothetical protein [Paenibacillus lautus]|uniref:hypothetical protein n=1 Tax=Paenibacillus lautus TaxID=1401 RepID=UPI0020D0E61E|nr:hypothetical protein [Paenibacillus lautus]